jgi:hypothetical protein
MIELRPFQAKPSHPPRGLLYPTNHQRTCHPSAVQAPADPTRGGRRTKIAWQRHMRAASAELSLPPDGKEGS